MNIKRKAALYTAIPIVTLAVWLFSLSTWYEATVLFTMVFLAFVAFVALPFVIYNLIYHYLIDKQDMIAHRERHRERMKELIDENKKASDQVQEILDSMKERKK